MKRTFKSNTRAQQAIRHNIKKVKHHEVLASKYAKDIDGLSSIETSSFSNYYYHMVQLVKFKFNVLHEIKQLELTLCLPHRETVTIEYDKLRSELHKLHDIAKYKVDLKLQRWVNSASG